MRASWGPVDLFFMSLKTRKRVKTLTGLFSRALKCESELGPVVSFFKLLQGSFSDPVGSFFTR